MVQMIEDESIVNCFATISQDVQHDAPAIWAHMIPVLLDLKKKDVKSLHVISDGPSNQYKNETNFHFAANMTMKFGFKDMYNHGNSRKCTMNKLFRQ